MRISRCVSMLLGCAFFLPATYADVPIIQGNTYAIGNGFTSGPHPEGSHFHSSNLEELPPGNPFVPLAGVAETGGFFGDEEIRGISEIALSGVAQEVTLQFEVLDLFELGISPETSGIDGIFGQGPFVGQIDVFAYAGDHVEALSDYQIATIGDGPLLTIDFGPNDVAGEVFSLNVTDLYNDLVAGQNAAALGLRMQMADPDPDAGAVTFGNFGLALTVPEPMTLRSLAIAALVLLAVGRRHR